MVYCSYLLYLLSRQSFDDDYNDFETKIQDLDRRLATIFCQAFDDCNCIESSAKVGGHSPSLQSQLPDHISGQ